MKPNNRTISFLADKKEMRLIENACILGADADANLNRSVCENGQFNLKFTYEELENLAGFISQWKGHETSKSKKKSLNAFHKRLLILLNLSDSLRNNTSPLQSPVSKPLPPFNRKPSNSSCYIFGVQILGSRGEYGRKEKVFRRIQIPGKMSLYHFAAAIIDAFGFDLDHCFGFYDNFHRYHDSKKMYELFTDLGEDPTPGAKSVKKSKINQVFESPGDKMLFLFDYGDGWHFSVKLEEIRQTENLNSQPVILESIGKAPEQYPDYESSEE